MSVIHTDALVIGAGPVGLFQVFQLGLLGVQAHVVDALPHPGGQCVELYGDKPIYDIPGIQRCTGQELTERLWAQIQPFQAQFHLGHMVTALQRRAAGGFDVSSSGGQHWVCKSVFIAAGVGAFAPRTLSVPGADGLPEGLVYQQHDRAPVAGRHVMVLGESDAALAQAVHCARLNGAEAPAQLTLVHRRDAFKADAALVAQMRALREQGHLSFLAAQVMGLEADKGTLKGVSLLTAEGETLTQPVDSLQVFLGLSPKLGPISDWGLAMERKQLVVDTAGYATSEPGLYAVGDINTYPGKKKLILCGFHEATLAAYAAMEHIHPEEKVLLQYTTTSPRLQARLGVLPVSSP